MILWCDMWECEILPYSIHPGMGWLIKMLDLDFIASLLRFIQNDRQLSVGLRVQINQPVIEIRFGKKSLLYVFV